MICVVSQVTWRTGKFISVKKYIVKASIMGPLSGNLNSAKLAYASSFKLVSIDS